MWRKHSEVILSIVATVIVNGGSLLYTHVYSTATRNAEFESLKQRIDRVERGDFNALHDANYVANTHTSQIDEIKKDLQGLHSEMKITSQGVIGLDKSLTVTNTKLDLIIEQLKRREPDR
jgi:hypothetical protein